MIKLSINELDLKDKKVILRTDFNVPLDKNGNITDDTRIVESLPTIKYILENGGSVIILSHLGRPKGKNNPTLSLAPCAKRLGELLGLQVLFAGDCIGEQVKKAADALKPKQVLMLENLRFHNAEEYPEENIEFAKQLASLGDVYVDDAFGAAHRAHASIVNLAQLFPEKSASGFLLKKEIEFFGNAVKHPKRPFYAIMGGAKISGKLNVIKALLSKIDKLFIGGGMSFTFFKAKGIAIGDSICENDFVAEAKSLLDNPEYQEKIILPIDIVVADSIDENAKTKVIDIIDGIPDGFQGVDIGPNTIQMYEEMLHDAATILWNGPLGVFEIPLFAAGTFAIAETIASLKAISIIGGGDSIAAIKQTGLQNKISHISTGGGASLEYIEKGFLPGVDALSNSKSNSKKHK